MWTRLVKNYTVCLSNKQDKSSDTSIKPWNIPFDKDFVIFFTVCDAIWVFATQTSFFRCHLWVVKMMCEWQKVLSGGVQKVANTKIKRFAQHSSIQLSNKYRIASESFKIYYPKNLYKQYNEAFESSLVNNYYSSNYIKKEVRKERTFYYEGIDTEIGIDKIIDEISPKIGIQYLFELVISYDLEKWFLLSVCLKFIQTVNIRILPLGRNWNSRSLLGGIEW